MSDTVVRASQISKKFCRSLRRAVSYGMIDIARNATGASARSDRLRPGEFWAVDDVSFELRRGEVLGIVGVNGSGKSTVLKMLNGLFMPDRGRIEVSGRMSALIEVGAGFHPMLTGRENIYINGAILGMPRREIDWRFDSIVEFSGVEDAIDTPLKFYSSGMYVRLGFAVAAHLDTDVLLVDEVLAVGDAEFRTRCFRRIGEMIKCGTAVILVSHNLLDLQRLCTDCIWLDQGQIAATGETMEVVTKYSQFVDEQSLHQSHLRVAEAPRSQISGGRINRFDILGLSGKALRESMVASGEGLRFRISYEAVTPSEPVSFSVSLRSADGTVYTGYSSAYDDVTIVPTTKAGKVDLVVPNVDLNAGVYSVCFGMWDSQFLAAYDWHMDAARVRVFRDAPMIGRFSLPHRWEHVD